MRVPTGRNPTASFSIPVVKYRPDIDGLRALAVIAVVLYHAEFKLFRGGYVGVDVFFVISGYLITKLIYEAATAGRFGYAQFYLRRARRLFPAAFVTLALSAAFATYLMAPQHARAFGGSLLHAAVSLSNLYFWSESGYFDADASLKPLLHTWSLAVEEQFYLIWPAFLVRLARRSRLFGFLTLLAVSVLGFAAAHYAMAKDVQAAFFLTPLRIWEFALGGLIVWAPQGGLPGYAGEVLTIAGIGMIAWSVFSYDAQTVFPGSAAVAPCLGTALAILAGDARRAGLLLRNPLSVFVGKTSYSFYLVHWPAIVLYKYHTFAKLSRVEKTGLVLGSFLLACLMWRYIEEPWRHPERARRPLSPAGFGLACAGCSLVIAFFAAHLWTSGGWQQELRPENQRVIEYLEQQAELNDELARRATCYTAGNDHYQPSECLKTAPEKINFLVVGDSYAAAAFTGMVRHFGENVQLSLAAHTGCRPLLEPSVSRPGCLEQTEEIFNKHDVSAYDVVFLVGAFRSPHHSARIKRATRHLRRRGARKIVVLGSPPSYGVSVADTFKALGSLERTKIMRRVASQVDPLFLDVDRELERADLGPASYVSMARVLCPKRRSANCISALPDSGWPIMNDATHLTPEGASWVFDQLAKQRTPWQDALRR
jgi:peptidoglycan/LPS O-acetylase OafA/YrhL